MTSEENEDCWISRAIDAYDELVKKYPDEIKSMGLARFLGESSFIEDTCGTGMIVGFFADMPKKDNKAPEGYIAFVNTEAWPAEKYPDPEQDGSISARDFERAKEIVEEVKRERFPNCKNVITARVYLDEIIKDEDKELSGVYYIPSNSIRISNKLCLVAGLQSKYWNTRKKAESELRSTLTHEFCHCAQANENKWKYYVDVPEKYWGYLSEVLAETEALIRGMGHDIRNGGTAGYYQKQFGRRWKEYSNTDWKRMLKGLGKRNNFYVVDKRSISKCLDKKNLRQLHIWNMMDNKVYCDELFNQNRGLAEKSTIGYK